MSDGVVVSDDKSAVEAQAAAQKINAELSRHRKILNADEMAGLVSPRAHFEAEFPKIKCYFFTIDGMLNGRKISGALFAAECMLVRADNYMAAADLANRGLRATIDLMHEEYNTRRERGVMQEGMTHVAGGRRGHEGDHLQKLPKLKRLIKHIIGGEPWQN